VDSNNIAELNLGWSRGFRADELTVGDTQDRFAMLDVSGTDLPHAAQEQMKRSGNSMPFGGACAKPASALKLGASSLMLNDYQPATQRSDWLWSGKEYKSSGYKGTIRSAHHSRPFKSPNAN
jgi:hypothetical protein